MSARGKWLAAGLVAAALGVLWLGAGRSRHRAGEALAVAEPSEGPQLAQRRYPQIPEAPVAAQPDVGAAATTAPASAATQPPPPAQVIKVGGDGPAPSPQPASAWAIDYRDAVCACHTRRCVGDVQGRFVRRLGAVVHADEADDARYTEATSAAIRCYFALPEGS